MANIYQPANTATTTIRQKSGIAEIYKPANTATTTIRPKELGIAEIYQENLKSTIKQGQMPKKTTTARIWLRDIAESEAKVSALQGQIQSKTKRSIVVGNMYMFNYSPKTAATLPYYDQFPVIFPFEKTDNGFYGVNLHYLPHTYRARLMDMLYTFVNNDKYDETTKLQGMSYNTLRSMSTFFKPCVKRYLNKQVTSRFIQVHPKHWELALFLPLEQFAKESREKVHQDSVRLIERSK